MLPFITRFGKLMIALFVLSLLLTASSATAEAWKFGVMSDTQWKANLDGQNPNSVAVGIINQLNQEFIDKDVRFVIQVGDLTDNGSSVAMTTRADAAGALYNAGICFYPLRGNHESSQAAALQFQSLYPQSQGTGTTCAAANFTSPFPVLNGLSYAFYYNNARFVLLDQFTRTDGTNYLGSSNNNIVDQQAWINAVLAGKPAYSHTFVFGHKNLIGQNHVDTLFGANPASNPDAQNAFIGSLAAAGVRYVFGGHDHMHHRSMMKSPDGSSSVQEIIGASNSYKFYIPQIPANDVTYDMPAFGGTRETPVMQELFTIGYYIVTVDGPRVTVDYYAAPNGCNGDCDLAVTPALTFSKRETFGYSLNGREFLVPEGGSYTVVQDRFQETSASILDGTNDSSSKDYAGRSFTQTVDTGWTSSEDDRFASSILTLWGMEKSLGSTDTANYVLSISYDERRVRPEHQGSGGFGIAAKDRSGAWVNAVDLNIGGTKRFVKGSWKPGYELGTYGVDPSSHTAWAVLNYNSDFAVARDIEPVPGHRK